MSNSHPVLSSFKLKLLSYQYWPLATSVSQYMINTLSSKVFSSLVTDVQVFSLPVQKSRVTVLRSPHIDKKSREQFETRISSFLLKVELRQRNDNSYDGKNLILSPTQLSLPHHLQFQYTLFFKKSFRIHSKKKLV